MTTATDMFDLDSAPMRIGKVRLRVRDLPRVAEFYRQVIGLEPVDGDERHAALGTGGKTLVELYGDPSLAPRDRRAAGLFHTAFLLPSRVDLGRWLAFAIENRIALDGASDHIVSEAIYLSDPEGNGIEIYADRPMAKWRGADGSFRMATDPLDSEGLLRSARDGAWKGFPKKGRVGHVHLQVGDTGAAERFYGGILGFDVMARYPGASFFGSGGYHHQLAGNIWNSRGAGWRTDGMAGLDRVEIIARDGETIERIEALARENDMTIETTGDTRLIRDAWGTAITLSA